MSKSADSSDDTDQSRTGDPEIEEDLFKEELRIDGICGVY